jgi:5'(3')-deoxyribonucleotidase
MKPIVLLDVDGVLADFVGPYLDVVNSLTFDKGITLMRHQREDVKTWRISESLGLTDEIKAAVDVKVKSVGFCAGLPVIDGAKEGVKALQEISEVYIATSPWKGPHWSHERAEWLEKHFGIEQDRVMQGKAKFLLDGDVLIDDKASTVGRWVARHPGFGLLWSTSHNLKDSAGLRVHGWTEVLYLVNVLRVIQEGR